MKPASTALFDSRFPGRHGLPYVHVVTSSDQPARAIDGEFFRNRPMLARYLRARGAGEGVEDLLQELWLKIAGLSDETEVADPTSYLFRMAHNLMLDRRRTELRREARDRHYQAASDPSRLGLDPLPTADRMLIARQQLAEVERVLKSLGERTDYIFRRHRVEAMPQRDIAAELGITVSAVEKHLQKAYRAVRAMQERTKHDPAEEETPRDRL